MEKTLSTEELAASEKSFDETAVVKKEEKMQEDSSRLDSLEEQLNQLRVDIAQIFEAMKGKKAEDMAVETKDEEAARKKLEEKDEMQGMPNSGGPSKTNMSATKKFTGAPVEDKVNLGGIVKSNSLGDTMTSVLAKMAATTRFTK
jgi:septal ring factor EnvC (AmiA/AmiB activator)